MSQKSSARISQRPSGSIKPQVVVKRGSSLNPPKQSSRSRLVLENNALATQLITGENQQKKEEEEVDQEVADTFQRVFSGQFDDLPQPMSKLVRVFTSSTFTDTTLERNALMEDVYPNLKNV